MTDQRKPLTEDEMILQTLSAEVRTKAREIVLAAGTLADANLNAGARETAQMINAAAGRLSALVHLRETTLARVQRDRGTPIRFAHAGECPTPVFNPASMLCLTCGHPAERHSNAEDLGDAQARPVAIGMTEHTTRDGRHIPSPPSVLGFLRSGPADAPSRSYGYAVTNCPGFHNGGVGRTCIRCGTSDSTHPARRP